MNSDLYNSTLLILKANDKLVELLKDGKYSDAIAQLEINSELNDKLKDILEGIKE